MTAVVPRLRAVFERRTPAAVGVDADPQFCGPCGGRFADPDSLRVHARSCWAPQAVEADAVRMLSNASIRLMDRIPTRAAGRMQQSIYAAARGLKPEQRASLAWLVDEFTDLLPVEAAP